MRKLAFFAAAVTRSNSESSPITLSCPSFSYCLRHILANNHRSHCKEPRNRVNVAFLRIGGGVYQSWARSAIILIIVRGMSRPRRSVFTPKRH